MAASNSGPWGPMPGGKPSGSVSQAASRPAPAVITLDDERRRYENVEQARRAQDRFLNSLSHRPNQITPPPPAAHGHMRPRMAPAHSPSGLKKSEMPGSMGHLPPPPHPHGVGHHAHPGHPGQSGQCSILQVVCRRSGDRCWRAGGYQQPRGVH